MVSNEPPVNAVARRQVPDEEARGCHLTFDLPALEEIVADRQPTGE
ncbi:hypothetical protein [Neolewinella xylanilytica]|nr:hypothetical protein [Neolewinella xylanilytica]